MAQDQKREAIIKAAQKRFAHFGVSKTTMTEIAEDVAMSKASLYYYFPDKLSLYASVIQTIIEAENDEAKNVAIDNEPGKAILYYLEARTQFLIRHYNILEYLRNVNKDIPGELKSIFSMARSRELKSITAIIEKEKSAKIIRTDDPKKVAELFLDCLEGLRLSIISSKANFFPDKKEFETLLKREKEFAGIFFRGLRL